MFLADLHVHTLASGHAYSTLTDYLTQAKRIGMTCFGLSDHGPAMPGGPHLFHIGNQSVIPREIEGIQILRGAEANILDFEGAIDIPDKFADRLDYMIASLHDVVLTPGAIRENTQAVIRAAAHQKVKVIGHLGNPKFPIEHKRVIEACGYHRVAIEINNSTFRSTSRSGSEMNCIALAKLAYTSGVSLILGSDAHIHYDLANFKLAQMLLEQNGIPKDYCLNFDAQRFWSWFGTLAPGE